MGNVSKHKAIPYHEALLALRAGGKIVKHGRAYDPKQKAHVDTYWIIVQGKAWGNYQQHFLGNATFQELLGNDLLEELPNDRYRLKDGGEPST